MAEAQPRRTVAFIGLGRMGLPMAGNLIKAGHAVRGFDLVDEARRRFASEGGAAFPTAAEAAAGAELVITMLPTDSIVREVLVGSDGIATTLPPGTVVVDMSSSSPLATRELGEALALHRVELVDAPVSGGVGKAEAGTLAIMAGGDAAIVDGLRALLLAMGASVTHTGPLGSGHAMKALNNYVSAAGLAAACEALIVGAEFGLTGETVTNVLNASTGRNNATENKLKPFVLSGRYDAGFAIGLMAKDLGIAAELAGHSGHAALGMAQAAQLWQAAAETLGPASDHTTIHRFLMQRG